MLEVGFHPISPTEGEPQAAVVTFGTEGYPDAIWRVASHALAAAPGTAIVVPHRSHGCEKRKKGYLRRRAERAKELEGKRLRSEKRYVWPEACALLSSQKDRCCQRLAKNAPCGDDALAALRNCHELVV
jgi:hypothetical protein